MQANQTSSVSGLFTCVDHPDKFVEIFCVDHRKPCCTVCATVKHRKCENVAVIEEAESGIIKGKQTMELLRLIMQGEKMLEKLIQGTQRYLCSVEKMGENIRNFSKIEKLKSDLIDHIKQTGKICKRRAGRQKEDIITEVTDRMTEMSRLKSTMDNWHNILSTCINDGSEI